MLQKYILKLSYHILSFVLKGIYKINYEVLLWHLFKIITSTSKQVAATIELTILKTTELNNLTSRLDLKIKLIIETQILKASIFNRPKFKIPTNIKLNPYLFKTLALLLRYDKLKN